MDDALNAPPPAAGETLQTFTLADYRSPEAARALLDKAPRVGLALSPAAKVVAQLLECYGPDQHVQREAARRGVERMTAELAGPSATPLERILAERVAVCHLAMCQAEARESDPGEVTFREADHRRRCAESAGRRFLASVKALAVVRKLAVPELNLTLANIFAAVDARRTAQDRPGRPRGATDDLR